MSIYKKIEGQLYRPKTIEQIEEILDNYTTSQAPAQLKKDRLLLNKEQTTDLLEKIVKPAFSELTGIKITHKIPMVMSSGSDLIDSIRYDSGTALTYAVTMEVLTKMILKKKLSLVNLIAGYTSAIASSTISKRNLAGLSKKNHIYVKQLDDIQMPQVLAHELTHFVRLHGLGWYKFYKTLDIIEEGLATTVGLQIHKTIQNASEDLTAASQLKQAYFLIRAKEHIIKASDGKTHPKKTRLKRFTTANFGSGKYYLGYALFAIAVEKHGDDVIKKAIKGDYSSLFD